MLNLFVKRGDPAALTQLYLLAVSAWGVQQQLAPREGKQDAFGQFDRVPSAAQCGSELCHPASLWGDCAETASCRPLGVNKALENATARKSPFVIQ